MLVLTSRKHLEFQHELTKKYPGLYHLVAEQAKILKSLEEKIDLEGDTPVSADYDEDVVCLEPEENRYFNISTPEKALEGLFNDYGKDVILNALKNLENCK